VSASDGGMREKVREWRAKGITLKLSGDPSKPLAYTIPVDLVGSTKSVADRIAAEIGRQKAGVVEELQREANALLSVQYNWAVALDGFRNGDDDGLPYSLLTAADARPERVEGDVVFIRMDEEKPTAQFICHGGGSHVRRLAEMIEQVSGIGGPLRVRFLVAGLLQGAR
jgi:hypothetical protein